ncbi:MAG: UPF0280 family protein [candidate division WOR-3 bacterium]
MKSKKFQPRFYRSICQHGELVNFDVVIKETDLLIRANSDLSAQATASLRKYRNDIEKYILIDQNFLTSLTPVQVSQSAPEIVQAMANASSLFGVGPMAAVAGAIAERVARHLVKFSEEVIIENGGDIFVINKNHITCAIFAGDSPLSMKLGIEVSPHPEGISICTSSGTVGHSLSFGRADAVVIISPDGGIADAAATAIGNIVKNEDDIMLALDYAKKFNQITGVIIVIKDKIGILGKSIQLVKLE